jgi:hypothetical protein
MTQTMMQQAPVETVQPQYLITDADRDRIKKINEAWKAYDGELPKPLKIDNDLDNNVMSNRCEPIVNTGVSFLFGKEVEISCEEGAPQEAQDFLNDAWGIKEQRIPLLQELAMSGGIAGRAFLRIVPSNEKPGRDTTYRLIDVDPSTMYVQTAPQDCETVLQYCIQYAVTEMINGQPKVVWYREEITRIDPDGDASLGKPDDDDTWTMQHWTFIGQHGIVPKNTDWNVAGPAILWPYPFAPIFSCKNRPRPHEFWGRPDITPDLIGMNNSYNFTQSNSQKVNQIYGHPWPYATGIGDSDLRHEPGRFTLLGEGATMGALQFQSDLPSAIKFAKDLRSDINEQSNIPDVATGRAETMPRGQISGIALELEFMPLIAKTDTKQCLYGKLILDVSQALLVLNGFTDTIKINLEWQSPLPHDDLQGAQYAVLLQQVGVSKTTILRKLGFDPDEEATLKQKEDQAALDAFSRGQGMPPQPPVPGQPAPLPGQPAPSPFIGGH